jgi:hypothetical protein
MYTAKDNVVVLVTVPPGQFHEVITVCEIIGSEAIAPTLMARSEHTPLDFRREVVKKIIERSKREYS